MKTKGVQNNLFFYAIIDIGDFMNNVETMYDILMNDNVVESINENLSTLLILIPELKPTIGFDHQHPHHHLDVWNHTLLAVSMSAKDFDIRLILLLHDIGKPFCYQEVDGIKHFHGHAEKSSLMSEKILERLGFTKEKTNELCKVIKCHDTPLNDKDLQENLELSLKRYEVQKCDALAHHPDRLEKRMTYLIKIGEKIKNKKK